LEHFGHQHLRDRRISAVTFTTTDSFNFTGGGERCGDNNGPFPTQTATPTCHGVIGDRPLVRYERVQTAERTRRYRQRLQQRQGRAPGFHNHDLSIFKNFALRGSQKMQFRWEIYNLFNSLSFNEVDTSAIFDAAGNQTDTNFGKVTSARNERRMQFSLRYTF
jgi:hypothetical protein